MLWQRVLTALVLAPLVVSGILYLDSEVLALVLGALILLASSEMAHLCNLRRPLTVAIYATVIGTLLCLGWWVLRAVPLAWLQWAMSIWWLLVTLLLITRRRDLAPVAKRRPATLLLGGLILVSAWISVVRLHETGEYGPILVLYLFVLIWVADIAAYFAGRRFGTTRLSPFVSPGKTWAGAAGAGAGAMLAGGLLSLSNVAGDVQFLGLILLSLLVTLVSIGGDLFESRLKREAGVKDSGSLLPGHGGILDRIDSLLAAAPVFALGVGLIGAGS